jgi:hypothetical protein
MSEPANVSEIEIAALPPLPRSPHDALGHPGAPPLIAGESAAAYEALLARVSNALNPADALEEIWIRDVVDLVWEVFRLRRLRAGLMKAAAREPQAVAKVEAALGSAGFGMDHVAARTFSLRLFEFERIDRMLHLAEQRRAAALRELDRHRDNFSHRLRQALEPIEEEEFEE